MLQPLRRAARLTPACLLFLTACQGGPAGDGGYRAELIRTSHGVAHITADDFGSLGYGEGYAAAEDHGVALFELTQELTAAAGLPAYEISNHAQPGAESRHNLTYWRGGDYAGIGPGAHGRLTSDNGFTATHQIHDPMRWLAAVERNGHGTGKLRMLGDRERAEEILMTGLRLVEGLDTTALSAATGFDLSSLTDSDRLDLAMDGGFLMRDGAYLRTTPAGRLILNTLVSAILTARET